MLGHSDRAGMTNDPRGQSRNSSHPSRDCSQGELKSTGGVGLLYCFATNWRLPQRNQWGSYGLAAGQMRCTECLNLLRRERQ